MLCYMATSHTNIHTVRGRLVPKKEIRCFRDGLVRELKVNERKLLKQSKTLFAKRRNKFLESEDYTSYKEKSLAKEMCIKFESEEISTTGEDCPKSNE